MQSAAKVRFLLPRRLQAASVVLLIWIAPAIGTLAPIDVSAEAPPHTTLAPAPLGALRIRVETPQPGATIASSDPSVMVAGRVLTPSGRLDVFDLVIVIDRSKSTDAPTGVDIDGDGWVGRAPESRYADGASDDRGDSVLAAEIVAARTLIQQLDPETTRVGVVAFAGDTDPETPDARVLAPLSADYAAAHAALDELLDEWPSGRTHMAAAIHVATAELLGIGDTKTTPRSDARRIILLMTDGQPTLPVPFEPRENAEATYLAARLAARGGIRIDAFAIGRDANQSPEVAQAVSALTDGTFTPVLEPRDLVSTFEQLRLASIRAVEVENRTSGTKAHEVWVESDGRYAALIDLVPGENHVEIRALGEGDRFTYRSLRVKLVPSDQPAALHPRFLSRKNRLLEAKLLRLRRRQVELEMELSALPAYRASERAGAISASEDAPSGTRNELHIEIQVEEPEPSALPASPEP